MLITQNGTWVSWVSQNCIQMRWENKLNFIHPCLTGYLSRYKIVLHPPWRQEGGGNQELNGRGVVFNPKRTGVFLDQSWTWGGGDSAPLPVSQPWGIWGIGARHDYCWLSSKDFFEVYNFFVAQNLTTLETTMHFCWKSQKNRTIF